MRPKPPFIARATRPQWRTSGPRPAGETFTPILVFWNKPKRRTSCWPPRGRAPPAGRLQQCQASLCADRPPDHARYRGQGDASGPAGAGVRGWRQALLSRRPQRRACGGRHRSRQQWRLRPGIGAAEANPRQCGRQGRHLDRHAGAVHPNMVETARTPSPRRRARGDGCASEVLAMVSAPTSPNNISARTRHMARSFELFGVQDRCCPAVGSTPQPGRMFPMASLQLGISITKPAHARLPWRRAIFGAVLQYAPGSPLLRAGAPARFLANLGLLKPLFDLPEVARPFPDTNWGQIETLPSVSAGAFRSRR